MPDNVQPQPQQTPPAPAAQVQSPAQSSRPAWLPEGIEKPEDFRARYDDLDRRWKETEPKLKTLERWEKWGDPDQFEKNLATRIAERDTKLRADIERELRAQQPAQQHRDPFEGYELLDPRQQAQVLRDQVAEGVRGELLKLIDGKEQAYRNQFGEMDQRFSLLSRALSA